MADDERGTRSFARWCLRMAIANHLGNPDLSWRYLLEWARLGGKPEDLQHG